MHAAELSYAHTSSPHLTGSLTWGHGAAHWQASRPYLGLCVSADGGSCEHRTPTGVTEHTDSDPNMIDPRFQAIYGSNLRLNFMQPSNTGYDYDITAYDYTLEIAPTATYSTVSIGIDVADAEPEPEPEDAETTEAECIGCHPAMLPLYHSEYMERTKVRVAGERDQSVAACTLLLLC